ncbi:hypothetical protein Tco_0920510 [Tanacetum coccineum]
MFGRFQQLPERRTPSTSEPSGNVESPSLADEVALADSETESDKEVTPINKEKDASNRELTEINAGVQDEGQARSDPAVSDASTQQNPEQMDEEFTTTAYPNELSFTDQFFIKKPQEEEPVKTNAETEVQSMVTVSIHQDTSSVPPMTTPVIDLTKSQSDSLTVHAPLPTSTATTTTVTTTPTLLPPPLQPQQSTTYLILIRCIGELEQHMVNLIQDNSALEERSYKTYKDLKNFYEALEKSIDCDHSDHIQADLAKARAFGAPGTSGASGSSQLPLHPHPPPFTDTNRGNPQQSSRALSPSKTTASTQQSLAWTTSDTRYELATFTTTHETSPKDNLINDDSIPDKKVQLSDDEDTGNDHLPKADMRKDWWKPLTKEERPATPEPSWTIPSSNVLNVEKNWASVLVSTYEPPAENSLLAKTGDIMTFMNWYCQKVNKTMLTQADFEGRAYEVANPEGDQVRIDVNRPLPLGGPLGYVTIQTQFFFNKDLEYLRYGNKESRHALLISKIKAARYPDFGLELLVPEQMWINEVCTYDISATYGISHWWFNRQKFYIERHDSLSHRREVKKHMRILSVIRIKAYLRYGYDYLSEILLRRADYQEYTIAKKDFKNLYPSDFKDLNMLLLQGHIDHLPGFDKRMLSTALNLTKPGWDAKGFEFKNDYTIIESPRAVVFPVNNNERKIMRFNEIYKFSDGTLTRILEALDYRVKEFQIKRLNLVDIEKVAVRSSLRLLKPKRTIDSRAKRSSINLIRTLFHITCSSHNVKTRVIIRVLRIILVVLPEHPSDTYVFTMKMEILLEPTSNKLMVDVSIKRTGKLGDFDVHTLEDLTLIMEILSRRFFLRLNLPDHRSVLTESGGSSKDRDGDTSFQWSLFHNRMLILN